MANSPDKNMTSTSFTLPRPLFEALKAKAKIEMTTPADIIRRALMNYLPENMRAQVIKQIQDFEISSQKNCIHSIYPIGVEQMGDLTNSSMVLAENVSDSTVKILKATHDFVSGGKNSIHKSPVEIQPVQTPLNLRSKKRKNQK